MKKLKLFILFICCSTGLGYCQQSFIIEDGKKRDKIKFELVNNLIILPVELNGVKLSFLLDTGVNTTVLLNIDQIDSLDLANAERIQLRGLGGEELINAYRSRNNYMKIGKTINENLNMFVIYDDKINFSPRLGIPVHGIIGTDFFKDLVVEINYGREFIRVHDPERFKKNLNSYSEVPLNFFQSKPYVEANLKVGEVEGTGKFLLDNGLSDAAWIFTDKLGIEVPENSFDDFLGLGLLGDVLGKRSRIESFRIKDIEVREMTASFPDSLSVQGLELFGERDGSIGSELLRRFNIVFDYPKERMFLRKNKWFEDAFNYNMSGIVLEHSGFVVVQTYETVDPVSPLEEGVQVVRAEPKYFKKFELKPSFKVVKLRENSPALLAGLKVGDEIISANGRKAYKFDLQDFSHLFSSEDGKQIRLEINRNGENKKITFRLKKIL